MRLQLDLQARKDGTEMSTLTRSEERIETIALELLRLGGSEDEMCYIAHEALDMALRGSRGWWKRAGSPGFNARMLRLRKKLDANCS